jgi:lysophospholipase L1-like esterase
VAPQLFFRLFGRKKRKVFYLLAALLLLGVAAEGLFRLVGAIGGSGLDPVDLLENRYLKFPDEYDFSTYRENAFGLRDREIYQLMKTPAVRILCLGDSTTWGQGVHPDQAYPARLERHLKQRFPDLNFSLLNAGRPGQKTDWGLACIETRRLLEIFQPHFVIIGFGWNHLWMEPEGTEARVRRFANLDRIVSLQKNLNRWRTYAWLKIGFFEYRDWSLEKRYYASDLKEHERLRSFDRKLTDLVEKIRAESNAQIILMNQPADPSKIGTWIRLSRLQTKLESYFLHPSIRRETEKVARNLNLPYVDMAERFEKLETSELFFEYLHPNQKGYDLIAQNLAETIAQQPDLDQLEGSR